MAYINLWVLLYAIRRKKEEEEEEEEGEKLVLHETELTDLHRGSGLGRSKHNCFSCSFPFVWSAHRNHQSFGCWGLRRRVGLSPPAISLLLSVSWEYLPPEILQEVMGFSDKMSAPNAAGWPSVLPTAIAEKRSRICSR
jgi:hypothetical protein